MNATEFDLHQIKNMLAFRDKQIEMLEWHVRALKLEIAGLRERAMLVKTAKLGVKENEQS